MKRPALILAFAIAILAAVLLLHRGSADDDPTPRLQPANPTATDGGLEATDREPAEARPEPARKRRSPKPSSQAPAPSSAPSEAPDVSPKGPATSPDEGDEPMPEPTVWPASGEGIQGAMAEALPKIRRCYDQALLEDPGIAGKIVVAFTIGTTDTASGLGQVVSAGIADATIEQTTMDDCLLDAMDELQFDPPVDGELAVNYPFMFSVE